MGLTKVCRTCGSVMTVDEFYGDSTMKDGYMAVCKVCWRKQEIMTKSQHSAHHRTGKSKLGILCKGNEREYHRVYQLQYQRKKRERVYAELYNDLHELDI